MALVYHEGFYLFFISEEYDRRMRIDMKKALQKLWLYAVDTLAPPDPEIRRIESLDLGAFAAEIGRQPRLPEAEEVICLFPYRSPVVRTSLVELKEFKNRRIAGLLGSLVYDALIEELADLAVFQNFTSPLVLPVPMTDDKRRVRGWNQCELILDALAHEDTGHELEISYDVLVKIRETEDQVGMSRAERFENQEGCFAVPPGRTGAVRGRNVIVMDDIVTTGATLAAAERALRAAGARQVVRLAVGH